jgi:hypothetical protein
MIIDGQSLRTLLAKKGIDLDLETLTRGEYYKRKEYIMMLFEAGIDLEKLGAAELGFVARLWDASDGRELLVLRHEHGIQWVEFSPDGRKLLTGLSNGTLRLVDAASGAELAVLRGHEGPVGCGRFSPDGQKVITASDDHTARLWDAASGAELAVLRGHEGPVRHATFSPDGRKAFTRSSDDGTIRLWQLPAYHSEGELLAYAKALALTTPSKMHCQEFVILPEQCTWPLP